MNMKLSKPKILQYTDHYKIARMQIESKVKMRRMQTASIALDEAGIFGVFSSLLHFTVIVFGLHRIIHVRLT